MTTVGVTQGLFAVSQREMRRYSRLLTLALYHQPFLRPQPVTPYVWSESDELLSFACGVGGDDFTTMLCEGRERRDDGVGQAKELERQRLRDAILALADEWGIDLHEDCNW